MKELLIGCGSRTTKDLHVNGNSEFHDLVRLDNNPDHKPDVLFDLSKMGESLFELTHHPNHQLVMLPFADNEFDEIHAYEVLEHLAQQGDYEFFFKEFTEYWRILKPGGFFMASCPAPTSVWAWADPSHKRIISKETLVFLSQAQYQAQIDKTSMSDFRYLYKVDFQTIYAEEKNGTTYFILKKC